MKISSSQHARVAGLNPVEVIPDCCSATASAVDTKDGRTYNTASPTHSHDSYGESSAESTTTTYSTNTFEPEEMPTDTPTCSHNCWTRSRRKRVLPGVRLRCLVCRALWVTLLQNHKKCPGFYSGSCKGDCGRPHVLARGTVPKEMTVNGKEERLNTRSLRELVTVRPRKGRKAKMVALMPAALQGAEEDAEDTTTECTASPMSLSQSRSEGMPSPSQARLLLFRHDPYSETVSSYTYKA